MHDLRFLSKETRLSNYSVVPNELYGEGISSTAMVVYAKLLNRANLSISNGRVDEVGRVYVLYRISDLAQEIGRSTSTIKEKIHELVDNGVKLRIQREVSIVCDINFSFLLLYIELMYCHLLIYGYNK